MSFSKPSCKQNNSITIKKIWIGPRERGISPGARSTYVGAPTRFTVSSLAPTLNAPNLTPQKAASIYISSSNITEAIRLIVRKLQSRSFSLRQTASRSLMNLHYRLICHLELSKRQLSSSESSWIIIPWIRQKMLSPRQMRSRGSSRKTNC